jgi:biotin carboxyl carrier protein
VVLERSGVRERYQVARYDNTVYVDGPFGSVEFAVAPRFPDPAPARSAGSLTAPMPGTVVTVDVAIGDRVEAGQPVLALEAMKMQHTISAPRDGVVRQLPVRPGQQVEVGTVLAVITSAEEG